MPHRTLLIGGTGILSTEIGAALLARGDTLTILNRGWSSKHPVLPGAEVLSADVREPGALEVALGGRDFDTVVDFVAFTAEDVRRDIRVFSGRTAQYIFISTAAAYQKPPLHLPVRESTPLRNPYWDYASNKIAAEDALVAAYRGSEFPVTIVRPGHTYDRTHVPLTGEWTAIDRMLRGMPVVVHGDGTSLWPLTHSRDFAAAFTALVGNPSTIGDSFHISADEVLTWDQITRTLASAAGVVADIVHVPTDELARASAELGRSHFGDRTFSLVLDNSKIKEFAPGWRATTSFARGAREIIEWFEAHPERKKVDPALDALFDELASRRA